MGGDDLVQRGAAIAGCKKTTNDWMPVDPQIQRIPIGFRNSTPTIL